MSMKIELYTKTDTKKQMWSDRKVYTADMTIVTALFDGRMTDVPHSVGIYDASWVDKLYRGISRNYSGMFDFICLTDKNYKFEEPIITERLSMSVDQYGWMCMVDMYRPNLCKGNRFTMGLDTIITGPMDDILNHNTRVGLCGDPLEPDKVCNAVTLASPEFCDEYWDRWKDKNKDMMKECIFLRAPSEMAVLRKYYNDVERLDVTFPNRILSYKAHVVGNSRSLIDSSIVYFHGNPKPHNIVHQGWVQENWK